MKRVGDESCDLLSKKRKTDNNDDTGFINYSPQFPSLQNISTACIAISLWAKSDIKNDIEKNCKNQGYLPADLERLEEKCVKKLDELSYPTLLKVKISKYVRPIISELLKCYRKNGKYTKIYELIKMGDFLHWTVEGTIDMAKSLEALINSNVKDKVSQEDLYHFACVHCLEDYIPEIWSKLPQRRHDSFREDYRYHIDEYWNAAQRNKLSELMEKLNRPDDSVIYENSLNLYQNMVSMSVYTGNKSALTYFWSKMTDQEKCNNIGKWLDLLSVTMIFPSFRYQECYEDVDNLFFLLSHLKDVDQQKNCFLKHQFLILRSAFFVWPYQTFFFPTMQKMMGYISKDVHIKIIADALFEIKRGRINSDLFREMWQMCPLNLKTRCIRKMKSILTPIGYLISVGDSDTALMILKDASYPDCKSLIFNIFKNNLLLTDIISSNKLNLLNEVLARTLTPDDMNIFKKCMAKSSLNFVFMRF